MWRATWQKLRPSRFNPTHCRHNSLQACRPLRNAFWIQTRAALTSDAVPVGLAEMDKEPKHRLSVWGVIRALLIAGLSVVVIVETTMLVFGFLFFEATWERTPRFPWRYDNSFPHRTLSTHRPNESYAGLVDGIQVYQKTTDGSSLDDAYDLVPENELVFETKDRDTIERIMTALSSTRNDGKLCSQPENPINFYLLVTDNTFMRFGYVHLQMCDMEGRQHVVVHSEDEFGGDFTYNRDLAEVFISLGARALLFYEFE